MNIFYFIFSVISVLSVLKKKTIQKYLFAFSLLFASDQKLRTLYNSLDPLSISQHLAFYDLYGDRPLGKKALSDAWNLMTTNSYATPIQPFSPSTLNALVSLVNKPADQPLPKINEQDLILIEQISSNLPHTKLKGHYVTKEEEVWMLPTEQIDLARGLFVSQFGSDQEKIRYFESMIDLMALQVLAKLPPDASPEKKVQTINQFIFEEMGFRFPPHSLHCQDIDIYTFLPSVLDSRRGVCLGVSILYLCLAQRLNLTLEMITPPGHIYVRYRTKEKEINIETTARGIHIDSEEYLSINTKSLQQRNIKEVIGLAHFNQAAVYWQKEEYEKALESYQKAEPYLPGDPLLKELMGYAYLFTGNIEKGKSLLSEVKDFIPDYKVSKETTPNDFLNGLVDVEGIKAVYKRVDEDRKSILVKKDLLEETIKKWPQFKGGYFHLAVSWIQLHRLKEALDVLKKYHTLEPDDPDANYYLAVLYMQRMDYKKAWEHLEQAEKIVIKQNYHPKQLKELNKELMLMAPK